MVAHRLDAQVTAAVLDRLDDPEAPWPADLDGDAAAVALGETSVRLAELDGIFRGDEISPAEHRRARTVLLERKATAVRRVQVVERGRPAAGRIRHTWPSLTTSARREVIARLAHRIVVHPASTPDRLEIEWKQ
jgi:hypothetical protein